MLDPGYYNPSTEVHSVPLIAGKGQLKRKKGIITDVFEKGNWRGMAVDATDAYSHTATRVKRHFVMYEDKVVILLDEIKPKKDNTYIKTLYQTAYYPVYNDQSGTVLIDGKKSRLILQFSGPERKISIGASRSFGKSWIMNSWAKEQYISWYTVENEYKSNPSEPLITVMTPLDLQEGIKKVDIKRSKDSIKVVLSGGQMVQFNLKNGHWEIEMVVE